MNPYALRRQHLKLVRLPISPPPHEVNLYEYNKGAGIRDRGQLSGVRISGPLPGAAYDRNGFKLTFFDHLLAERNSLPLSARMRHL